MQNCALHALPWPLFVSIFFNYLVDLCRLDSGVKKWEEKLETTVIIRGGGKKGIVVARAGKTDLPVTERPT
jgi:hypothetical protein